MDSLQKQMEEHTVTVHESMSSLTSVEEELVRLGERDDVSKSSTLLNNNVVENNNSAKEEAQPS